MHKYIIYGLIDPRTNEIRYVGQSTCGTKRIKQHFYPSHYKSRKKRHVYNWINQLLCINLKPEYIILQELQQCENIKNELDTAECTWIKKLRDSGNNLTNLTDGGGGSIGYKASAESRAKMSVAKKGKKLSDAHVENIRAANKCRSPMTNETKKKISISNKGKKRTAEMNASQSENNPMSCKVICINDSKVYSSMVSAARYYNVSYESIGRVCKGALKSVKGIKFAFFPYDGLTYNEEIIITPYKHRSCKVGDKSLQNLRSSKLKS